MRKAMYKAVMDGKGGLFVVKRHGWWNWFFFGSRYLPVSNSLKDEIACDEFVAREKLKEAGKLNLGQVVKEYP